AGVSSRKCPEHTATILAAPRFRTTATTARAASAGLAAGSSQRATELPRNLSQRALQGATARFHQLPRGFPHFPHFLGTLQQMNPFDARILGASHLNRGSGFHKSRSNGREIFHGGTENRHLAKC